MSRDCVIAQIAQIASLSLACSRTILSCSESAASGPDAGGWLYGSREASSASLVPSRTEDAGFARSPSDALSLAPLSASEPSLEGERRAADDDTGSGVSVNAAGALSGGGAIGARVSAGALRGGLKVEESAVELRVGSAVGSRGLRGRSC